MGVKTRYLLSLDCHSKQAGDERDLSYDVPFFDAKHLPFPHHVHDLISLQGSPRALKGKEALSQFDTSFDEPVILFDDIVEIFDADVSLQLSGTSPSSFSTLKAFGLAAFLFTVSTRGSMV